MTTGKDHGLLLRQITLPSKNLLTSSLKVSCKIDRKTLCWLADGRPSYNDLMLNYRHKPVCKSGQSAICHLAMYRVYLDIMICTFHAVSGYASKSQNTISRLQITNHSLQIADHKSQITVHTSQILQIWHG